jgi:Domain of unknown function (DUF2382)
MRDFSEEDYCQVMHGLLNERQWRLYAATEAKRRGTGGKWYSQITMGDWFGNEGHGKNNPAYYQREAETGHCIVAVAFYGHGREANDILYRAGAYTAQTSLTRDLHTLPLREEVLTAQTQPVESGKVLIRKEVVTVQREEQVVIEKRPIVTGNSSSASARCRKFGTSLIPCGEKCLMSKERGMSWCMATPENMMECGASGVHSRHQQGNPLLQQVMVPPCAPPGGTS